MKRVFIVDDDVAILEVLQLVLEEDGYAVSTDTGYHVMEIMERDRPDVVLLDIWMRGLDGRELSRQIKADPKFAQTPVILMSAHSHSDSVVKEAQADGFIEKPFDIDDVLRMLKRYL